MQSSHSDLATPGLTYTAFDKRGRSSYLSLDIDKSDSDDTESRDLLEELKPRPISIRANGAPARIADELPTLDAPERVNRLSSASDSTYVTARSVRSSMATFQTATTGNFSLHQASTMSRSSWYNLLKSRDLIPSTLNEKNWSGRGEHAEFKPSEAAKISEILQVEEFLGSSGSTIVQKVRCRRILLARKTIKCNSTLKRSNALKEVEHLRRLPHSHIVQVVGTYTFKQEFSILLYPAAEQNLDSFLEGIIVDYPESGGIIHFEPAFPKLHAVYTFFSCLARALRFLHQKLTKHMDIKPKNLLVKCRRGSDQSLHSKYKIYLADFGITRSYARAADAETESPTGFTRLYAAPEVTDQRKRGFPADVFSLGCVFTEMLSVLTSTNREATFKDLKSLRVSDEYAPASYAENITLVTEWLRELSKVNLQNHFFHLLHPLPDQLVQLLELKPARRPTAESIASWFKLPEPCCEEPSAPDSLAIEDEIDDDLFSDQPTEDTAGGREQSIFYISRDILDTLGNVPLLKPRLSQLLQEEGGGETDPVSLLWRLLRRGDVLLAIYNSLCRDNPLSIPSSLSGKNSDKWIASYFLRLCNERLELPSSELFILGDLYADDTNGFVKVTQVVQRIIGLFDRNQNLDYENSLPMRRDDEHNWALRSLQADQPIIDRFVRMERIHVSQLELLHGFKEYVGSNTVLSSDKIHDIFLNLDPVLDMHRRFLIGVEKMYSRPHQHEDWANLFLSWMDAFAILEPYASNQADSLRNAMQNYRKLQESVPSPRMLRLVQHPAQLSSFLSEPIEHLRRYQWFLYKLDNLSCHATTAVTDARERLSTLLQRITKHANNEKSIKIIRELNDHVVDWKHLKVETFGHVLLHGVYYVKKSDDTKKHKYTVLLFERILCIFKDLSLNPKKRFGIALFSKAAQDINPLGQPTLQLLGRISMQGVRDVISLRSPTYPHKCQIFWEGDQGIKNFVIEFPFLSSLNEWASAIKQQRQAIKASLNSPIALENLALENPPLRSPYMENSDSDGKSIGKTITSEPSTTYLTGSAFDNDTLPSDIMVKVHTPLMAKTAVTLEIETTITYPALLLRIIAHSSNVHTSPRVNTGLFKLKYFGGSDFVTIKSDEDVQTAFERWWEAKQENSRAGTPEEESLLLYLESTN